MPPVICRACTDGIEEFPVNDALLFQSYKLEPNATFCGSSVNKKIALVTWLASRMQDESQKTRPGLNSWGSMNRLAFDKLCTVVISIPLEFALQCGAPFSI